MKKLNIKEKQKVYGGSMTGSFLNGIASIITSSFTAINSLIGSISGVVFMSNHKNEDKVSVTIGGTKMEYDNTQSNKALIKQEVSHDLPPLF
ncbi:hypothetical protein STIUS_v1c04860 [Spiroplasma sp. TIUS-1]|uniref:hypothetical protein n=1 Tax=Spiroplasma sp. TIUS-1 TaxID=216963 RepID=UPI001397FAF4|nr:hypothetical protein [Spiroplasma sp. TIUS-1]QHX36040.1 hypothetical protein STIUS_v1c04860 [Spiroplasma sp. TIUS-1]